MKGLTLFSSKFLRCVLLYTTSVRILKLNLFFKLMCFCSKRPKSIFLHFRDNEDIFTAHLFVHSYVIFLFCFVVNCFINY
jgi:hypothetical protein